MSGTGRSVGDRSDDEEGAGGDRDDEQALRSALSAWADRAYGDSRPVPAMSAPHRRRLGWAVAITVAIVAVAAAVIVPVLWLVHDSATPGTAAARSAPPTLPASTASATPPVGSSAPASLPSRARARPHTVVQVTADLDDGETVGVGEPIVLNFAPAPTDSAAFTKAVTVTVNGKPATGAWYWEKPYADQPVQAHYREAGYWPPDATINVGLPIGGLSAGAGRVYAGKLTSIVFHTGDAHVSMVNGTDLKMTVTSNGRVVNTVPVSLGAAATPTSNGVKVVMQKGEDAPGTDALRPNGTVMMNGPGYSDDPVPWSVRVTASGEYVHAAGWNTHIGVRSTSNGCTNLKPADGQWFYRFSRLGDIVQYVDISDGKPMNPLDGLGDWNIPWEQWSLGGRLLNHH